MSASPPDTPRSSPAKPTAGRWTDRLVYPMIVSLLFTGLVVGGQRATTVATPLNAWCSPSSRETLVEAETSLLLGRADAAFGLAEEVLAIEPNCSLAHELQAEVHFVSAVSNGSFDVPVNADEALACFRSAATAARSNPDGRPRLRALLKVCSARDRSGAVRITVPG